MNAVGLPGLDSPSAQNTDVSLLPVLLAEQGEDATLLPVSGSPLIPEKKKKKKHLKFRERVKCECIFSK